MNSPTQSQSLQTVPTTMMLLMMKCGGPVQEYSDYGNEIGSNPKTRASSTFGSSFSRQICGPMKKSPIPHSQLFAYKQLKSSLICEQSNRFEFEYKLKMKTQTLFYVNGGFFLPPKQWYQQQGYWNPLLSGASGYSIYISVNLANPVIVRGQQLTFT